MTYPDRLTRFGFKTLKELLSVFGIEVVVLNHEGKELRAVSYTHLTLPTNREV